MADGKTQKEALENTQLVIHDWIETAKELEHDIPIPQGDIKYA